VQDTNASTPSTIGSCLDYCNSLLVGITAHNIARLQRAQKNTAKVVCHATRYTCPKPLLTITLAAGAAANRLQNCIPDI